MPSNPEIVVKYRSDTAGLDKGLKQINKSASGIGRGLKVAGAAAAAGIGLIGVAAAKTVKDASNLNESMNAVNVVFGKAAKTVLDFGEKAAARAGLSMREFNEAVTPIGASLINVGFSAQEAAKASIDLTQRAADMASVFNTTVPDALQAIQAGLRGEADPLERFGVGLSDAAVKAEAMAMGLAKSEKALTAQDKAQARLNLLMKQTDRVAGDFVNTADGFANAQRIIGAQFENISATIGGKLLPVVAQAAVGFSKFLARFGEADGAGAKFRVVIDEIRALASRLFETLRTAIGAINWAGVWAQARGLADGLQKALAAVDWSVVGGKLGDGIAAAFEFALPKAKEGADRILAMVREVNWVDVGKAMGPGLAAAVVTAIATIADPVFWIKNWELALAVAAVAFRAPVGKLAVKLAPMLGRLGESLVLSILSGIERFAPRVAAAMLAAFMKVPAVITTVGVPIMRAITAVLGKVLGFVESSFGRLGRMAVFTVRVLGIAALVNAISQLVSTVKRKLSELIAAIPGYASQALSAAYGIGVAMIQGMIDGVVSMASSLAEKAASVVTGALDAAAKKLHIRSPSLVWAALGVDTIRGYILGITTEQPKLNEKTAEAVTKALDAARLAVERKQESFRAAFDRMGELAGRAFEGRTAKILDKIGARFDAAIGRWGDFAQALTPAEAAIAGIQQGEEQRQRDLAVAAAKAAADAAQTEEQRLAAQEQLRQANQAQEIARLQVVAAEERRVREQIAAENIARLEAQKTVELQNAEERRRQAAEKLDEQLANLRERLAKHPEEHAKIQAQIVRLLKRYGVSYKQAGKDLGLAFAEGLDASQDAVEKSAAALARVVARYLPHSPAEKGPLARDDFFADFGSMLAANLLRGAGALASASARMAGVAAAPLSMTQPAIAGGAGSTQVRVYIGDTELRGIVHSEVVTEQNRVAQTLLAGLA